MNQTGLRKKLYSLLGDLPARRRRIGVKRISQRNTRYYVLEKLMLDINGQEPVPAYFVKPKTGKGPFPAVLYNHAHGGNYRLGKDELIKGRSAINKIPYAEELARQGYAGLCIDTWAFGERAFRRESEIFKQMLWQGQVMWGMMVYDNLRALDYLTSRPDVDKRRIGTLGISMGSTMAWWTAALDTRVKVCVDICCLTDYEELIKARGLDGHGIYYYVPSLLKHFDTATVNGLIAPRAHLSLAGDYDRLTPVPGLVKIDKAMKKVYKKLGHPAGWRLSRYKVGHVETAGMRREILSFLSHWL